MENQNLFAAFIDERTKSLTHRIDEAEHKLSNEHIRRVRVGLKRWRTLYHLVMVLMPHQSNGVKADQSVKRLFKRAGKLRDCQQTRALLADLKLPAKQEKKVGLFLKKREKKARRRLKKTIGAFRTKQVRKFSRFVGAHNNAIGAVRVRQKLHRLIDQETKAIQGLQQSNPSAEQLHAIRKHLKSMIELSSVLIAVTQDKSLNRPVRRAKRLQTRLGNWHDQIGLVEQLSGYMARHPNRFSSEKNRALFDRYNKAVDRKTTRIRRDIGNLTPLLSSLTPWHTDTSEH